jgi:hypothetical protein
MWSSICFATAAFRLRDNLGRLPHDPGSVIVRSVFQAGGAGVARVPGYNSASLTQNIDVLLTGYANGQFRLVLGAYTLRQKSEGKRQILP